MNTVLTGKFIALSASKKKLECSHANYLKVCVKALERIKHTQEEYIAGNNQSIRTKRTLQKKIAETKSWFFETINKIEKPLAKLTKRQRDSIQINTIMNEKGDMTRDTEEIQRIIRSYIKSLILFK